MPASKRNKIEINENFLYEADHYVVNLTPEEKQIAEAALLAFKGQDYETLFHATKKLQRLLMNLSVKEQQDKFPWMKYVSRCLRFINLIYVRVL